MARVNIRGEIVATEEELKNGWTDETVAEYVATRERIANRVAGNVVTEVPRPSNWKPPVTIHNTKNYNPFGRR